MAIETWNTTFGSSVDKLEYSTSLVKALLRLRAFTELSLPFFPDDLDDIEDAGIVLDAPEFPEIQNDSLSMFASNSLESFMMRQRTPQITGRSPRSLQQSPTVQMEASEIAPRKRVREETPEVGSRKACKRTGKASLRHDDSQIQFAPIESSPLAEQVLDSQVLTERQKEVRERQHAEAAAMFADIRSSPRQKASSADLEGENDHQKSSVLAMMDEGDSQDEELPATPTLGTADEDDFITSSPTPTRSARGDREESVHFLPSPGKPKETSPEYMLSADEDIPSSPPSMPSPSSTRSLTQHMEIPIDISAQTGPYRVVRRSKLSKSTSVNEVSSTRPAHLGVDESSDLPSIPTKPASVPNLPGATEVFVDAMSSPASSDKQTVDGEIFMDAVSSPQASSRVDEHLGNDSSSSLSDLDESSMIRVMAEFDAKSGRSNQQNSTNEETSPAVQKESIDQGDSQSSLSGSIDCIIVRVPEGFEPPKPPNRRIPGAIPVRRSHRSTSVSSRHSSIPETPETGGSGSKQANELQVSPKLRVIVNVPATRSSPRRKVQTSTISTEPSPVAVKRKLDEAKIETSSEVPDSQEGIRHGEPLTPFCFRYHSIVC